jgi:site-specific DNA-methyltransferase (adenine-specific)
VSVDLRLGDCRRILDEIDDASIDSCVTDPPYALVSIGKRFGKPGSAPAQFGTDGAYARASRGFMGKTWDTGDVAHDPAFWAEVLRVLKPGAHLLAFGGTRTYHRLATAVEDAGFEIRDQIGWTYGSGFPKSHNQHGDWEGWGTALKPAWEPIVMARKPFVGTVEANLLAYGTGAINIDGCRVATGADAMQAAGRWPANLIHDGSDEVLAAFPTAPGQLADASTSSSSSRRKTQNVYGLMKRGNGREGEPSADSANNGVVGFLMKPGSRRGDVGSAARFFYCAKASKSDREEGLPTPADGKRANTHPTVKPTNLMRYLCRLVTPPDGTVLDPFMGSGSTGRGAVVEGFNFIGAEMDAAYFAISRARIAAVQPQALTEEEMLS